jgi:GNAT superfamily N-acetyltransferase
VTEGQATIRERRADDLEAAARALIAVHATDGYPVEGVSDPVTWLQPPTLLHAWVAELAGDVVGHVLVSSPTSGDDAVRIWREQNPNATTSLAVLGRLFLTPEARGRRLGERLVLATTAYAKDRELQLLLDVMVKDTAAIHLYERLGWQRIGETLHRFGQDDQTQAFCYLAPP